MHNVIVQIVVVIESYFFNLGQLILEMEQVVKDVFQVTTIYSANNIYSTTYDYSSNSVLSQNIQTQIQNCLPAAGVYSQISSICLEATLDQSMGDYQKYLLGPFMDLDNYIPNLYQQQNYADKVYRVMIQTYSNPPPPPASGTSAGRDLKRNIFKIYPASYLDCQSGSGPNQYTVDSRFYQNQQQNMEIIYQQSLVQKIFIQGPYEVFDYPSSKNIQVMSLSNTFMAQINSEKIFFNIRVELLMSTIDAFLKQQNYQSKNEIIIVNKNGTFVYITDYWQLNQQSLYIFDQTMQKFSGLDEQTFQDLVVNQEQIQVNKLNKDGQFKEFLVSPILLNNTFDANDITQYLQTGVYDVQNNSYFVILLYGEKDQMYEVISKIESLAQSQKYITKLICVITSFVTIILVYVATYIVSVKVDRPLKLIINILKKLNNSVTLQQNVLLRIKDQLLFQSRNSQYQVRDLLLTFIDLIETLIQRFQDKTNNTISITIEYPLNDLETSFLQKTKGKKFEFDWENLNVKNQQSKNEQFGEANDQDQQPKKQE
ncbi:transmembrane protein, putative (macronuclear) [Tetrahymena thermophila SB210]|uniref:Transmembrane protein, putative n=1 Tax=Tetrahymena thermophila (strain SB210) TaxID=312017 RepID=I7LXJ0_TETTS|nr:transmembrane protein, putative [Tetrahymena thermophila SB210]EAS04733.2 transmembrane protein, putative [Tetrahymena thermophila SB210]|eukprot:XP_001024978.2 transmembrane protein, putative [Tetrahymena thermophila SB210]